MHHVYFLGLGSTRITELFRLKHSQVYWKNDSFYYLSISHKRANVNISDKKVVTHKLPPSISRYILLYDCIGREFCKGRDAFLFNGNEGNLDPNYDNKKFFSEFARMLELNANCSCLVMRHLYTGICNYLFPGNNNNFDRNIVSTVGCIAEMSGHSVETHEQYYSSAIDKETFFEKYHQGLGEDVLFETDSLARQLIPSLVTEEEALHVLKMMLGVNARFLSELQKQLILDSCNNMYKHTFCTIGCGGGKSMSWMVPPMRQSLRGVRPRLSLVIVPYCFLIDHHMSSAMGLVGQRTSITIECLKGKDVDDNIRPNVLRDKHSLPSILFLSLEATKLLVDYHFDFLEELGNENLFYKIFIDECHTLLSELSFRSNYHALGKLAGLNIPTVLFSGSFQRRFVKDYLKFMFGSDDLKLYNLFIDKKILGGKLVRIEHKSSSRYIGESCNSIIEYISRFKDSSVHVIVATLDEGEYQ